MLEWLEGLAVPQFAAAVLWTFAALILLVIVLIIIRLIRSLTFGTFVAGGRNRKTRLAVMDATAVDSHRRLVLVRRDDVEHLLLIGGPTDVVVEREIRLSQVRRPALAQEGGNQVPAPPQPPPQVPIQQVPVQLPPEMPPPRPRMQEPPPPPQMRQVRQAPPPERLMQRRPQPAPQRQAEPAPRPAPPRIPVAPPPAARPAPARQQAPRRDDLDDALMRELEVSFDEPEPSRPEPLAPPPPPPGPPPPLTLDDEMTKLLGELSNQKR